MDYEKEVNGTKYTRCHYNWLTGIQVDSLHINLIKDDKKFYEKITCKAEFIQELSLCYLSELEGSCSFSRDIDLRIVKKDEDISIEESARANFSDYLTPEDNPDDYGLRDCINKGFSHLSIISGRIKCNLVLEDNTFEKLISLIKSNSLCSFSFAPSYLSIYTEEPLQSGNFVDKNQKFHIINSEGSRDPASTFGALSDFHITTNDWQLNRTDVKSISNDFLILTETLKQIFSQLVSLSNLILYGFTATIILLTIIIIFK